MATNTPIWTSRVSRRRVMRGGFVAASGLAAARLLGCRSRDKKAHGAPAGGAPGPVGVSAADAPIRGGTFKTSNTFSQKDRDPHTSLTVGQDFWALWGDRLFEQNFDTGALGYRLAQSAEVAPDG